MEPAQLFTGLDLHKRSITATTLDTAGNVVSHSKFPCNREALLYYFADCSPGNPMHRATVEATTGWYWVSDTLAATDIDLRLAHAKGVKAICSAKVKTDAADARMLAQLLRTNLLPEAHMIDDDIRPLRDVFRTRLSLVERSSAAKNSIARLLEKMNVRQVDELPELMQLQAQCHLDQIELIQTQVKALERSLHPHLVPDKIVQRLLRIPGIGKACAFTIRLEVDRIDRFADERAFFSYCRLVPGANNSGDRVKHKRSREGNRYLKMTFGNASVRAVQYYPEVRSWYLKKKRRKGERIAKSLVAKELARIVYHVWQKDEDFNGRFKGQVLGRVKQEQWPLLRSPNSLTDRDEQSS
jgi:transposase